MTCLCGTQPSRLRRPVRPRPSWPACVALAFVARLYGFMGRVGLCGLGLSDQLYSQLLSCKSPITCWSSRASILHIAGIRECTSESHQLRVRPCVGANTWACGVSAFVACLGGSAPFMPSWPVWLWHSLPACVAPWDVPACVALASVARNKIIPPCCDSLVCARRGPAYWMLRRSGLASTVWSRGCQMQCAL